MDDPEQRFTAMYDRWYPKVLAYVLTHAAQHVAEDIVSDTFLVAWRRLAQVPEPPLPWLLATARNIGYKHRDGHLRRQALVSRIGAMARDCDFQEWDVAEVVVERSAALRALAALSADDLELLVLTVWQGLDAGGVGAVLGCSRVAASVRLHRARRRLGRQLRRAGGALDDPLNAGPEPALTRE